MARRMKQYMDFTSIGSGPIGSADMLADGSFPKGAATGATGDENVLMFNNGETLYHHVLGTQTLVTPNIVAAGLDISQDLTQDDGMELCGAPSTGTGIQFTVGTDAAFYFSCAITCTDVSGTDDFAIGFRKVEAFQAALDNYDEMAAFNLNGSGTTTKVIQLETILNGATTVTTATGDTWADTASKTLKVMVSAAGVVTFTIDGSAPTTTAAFTFDDAEVVTPFVHLLHASDVAEATIITAWDVGFQ